jgi:hypothetical protein
MHVCAVESGGCLEQLGGRMRRWCATFGMFAIATCTTAMVGVVEQRWRLFAPIGAVRIGIARYLNHGDLATLRSVEAARGEPGRSTAPPRVLRAGVGREGRADCDTTAAERDAMPYVDADPDAKPMVGRSHWAKFSRRCAGLRGEQSWPEGPRRNGGRELEGVASSA